MKTVLLAGGKGTRLSEETRRIPKPLVQIGEQPILWHIMKIYAEHGYKHFCVALGYKGDMIRSYFSPAPEDWSVDLVDTGLETMTAGRVRRLADHLDDGPFMLTYGDGVADINISALVRFHKSHGKLATVTAVRPPARFGALTLDEDGGGQVVSFEEKPQTGEGWINGGFFVFERGAREYIFDDDSVMLEREPLKRLAAAGQMMAYQHEGFWHPMDTLRDKEQLEEAWRCDRAQWKTWT